MKGDSVMKGNVVMMVAEGDPHDIGKNIAAVMLRSHGYGVIDMGRDVPVDDVVKTCPGSQAPARNRNRTHDHHHVRIPEGSPEARRERHGNPVHLRRRCS